MTFYKKHLLATLAGAVVLTGLGLAAPLRAQEAAETPAVTEAGSDSLEARTEKFNAYVSLMNRTLRAVDSIDRYKSWVNWAKGPTGKERIIYGLYSVYDTKDEAAEASAKLTAEPQIPELDNAMRDYIAANAALSPILNEASSYYERKDYLSDKMAGGKELHARIVPAAQAFLAARARLDAVFKGEKRKADELLLAAIEKREGRKADWQVKNVMIQAQEVVDLMPTNASPVVNLPEFDAALDRYAAAVKEMDAYGTTDSNAFSTFEYMPRDLLGKLREFRQKVGKAKGDARRAGGNDVSFIVQSYNMMVSASQSATTFAK